MTTRLIALGALVLGLGTAVLAGGSHVSAAPSAQMAEGAALFAAECARCHGDALEGGDGPPLAGPGNALGTYRNAYNLVMYAMENMPNDRPATLAPEQYAQVIGFILAQNGIVIPEGGLTPENAPGIVIP